MVLDDVFYKQALIKMRLVDHILSNALPKHILAEQIAEEFQVNLNTVKKVFQDLNSLGYLISKKKAGTIINYKLSADKQQMYKELKLKFNLWKELGERMGFSSLELLSGVAACFCESNNSTDEKQFFLVDTDYDNLYAGKVELEEQLSAKIIPLLLDDCIALCSKQKSSLPIVTTYYCLPVLKQHQMKAIPLKVTPDIEELIDLNQVPSNARIIVITKTLECARYFARAHCHLKEKYAFFQTYSLRDVLLDPDLLKAADFIFVPKFVYLRHQILFKAKAQIITYNRFYDQEGIFLLRQILAEQGFNASNEKKRTKFHQ